jgi:hypothetical protein
MSKDSLITQGYRRSTSVPPSLLSRLKLKEGTVLAYMLAFALPCFSSLLFALLTNHAWEDWFITYRASKNLALGHGLVYDIGERVHSFTSPIGTLLPAAIRYLVTGASDDGVLWIFRAIQCGVLGFTGVLLFRLSLEFRLSKWPLLFLIGMFSIDAKILDFSTNGMETGFFVFFVTLTAYSLLIPLARPAALLGLAWAGLMWTRPDGFVYIIALGLGFLLFPGEGGIRGGRARLVKTCCIAAAIGALLYLPWLVWTWLYYGSFIPHSLTSKAASMTAWGVVKTLAFPLFGLTRETSLDYTFTPAYISAGGWPGLMPDVSRVVSWICCFAWVVPRIRPATRAISFAVLVAQLYLSSVPLFAWYIPVATLLSLLVLALLLEELNTGFGQIAAPAGSSGATQTGLSRVIPLLAVGPILSTVLVTLCVGYELRIQQHVIEDRSRKPLGLWLHDHASSPRDRVFLEPLGYIGFYSNLRMYGFPGQSSPELVAARHAVSCVEWAYKCFAPLITYLKPEWVVLRPQEAAVVQRDNPNLLEKVYSLVKTYDVSAELASFWFLPGRGLLRFDQTFLVYRRRVIQ